VDSQLLSLRAAGADTDVNFALSKAAAQTIHKTHDIGWRPSASDYYPIEQVRLLRFNGTRWEMFGDVIGW